jgi:hypothetical protein
LILNYIQRIIQIIILREEKQQTMLLDWLHCVLGLLMRQHGKEILYNIGSFLGDGGGVSCCGDQYILFYENKS